MTRMVVAVLALAAYGMTSPAVAGVYFSAVTTTEGGPGGGTSSTSVRAWVQGDKARVEFTASKDPLLKPGRFLLTLDGGRSVYLVDPEDRTFSEWTGEAAVWAAGATAGRRVAAVEKLGEEDGGELIGVATRRVRFRTSYASGAATPRAGATVVVEEELWVAPELAEASLGIWMRQSPQAARDDEADASAAADRERRGAFPLKRVATVTGAPKGGGKTASRVTTTVTELSVEEVSAGTFTMGSGFREKALSPGRGGADQQATDTADEVRQEDQQYPFEEMLQPEPDPAAPQPQPGQPAQQPGTGARPAVPPTPPPAEPEPPQEDPEYPFERMLDTPN